MSNQLPVIYQPTSIGLYSANAGTLVSQTRRLQRHHVHVSHPEAWYLVK
ncbi:MAG TPA: hypothetical protein VME22_06800 [Solirubrobacteraceae bacterium]|nr:hypothetical protein [Solirubrobacteraceae bacterium]